MVPRPEDDCKTGFVNWPILTLKHWGESPLGEWKFEVIDTKDNKGGKVVSVKLTVYGTKTAPAHYSTARTYEYLVDSEWDKFPTAQCPALRRSKVSNFFSVTKRASEVTSSSFIRTLNLSTTSRAGHTTCPASNFFLISSIFHSNP
ncbi:hypothetical protein M8J76_016460 [Diaphorina citri]|nr:hypothetical protein M8J76_016460 [Diaphorina citri]